MQGIPYLIVVMLVLAVWHLLVDGAVTPASRAALRLRLFAARDRIRRLRINGAIGEDVYRILENRANTTIYFLSAIDPLLLIRGSAALARDDRARKRIAERQVLIEQCPADEAREIEKELGDCIHAAFAINSLVWLIYIIPLVGALFILSRLKRLTSDITYLREHEAQDLGLTRYVAVA